MVTRKNYDFRDPTQHIRILRVLSLISWTLSALLIYLASFLPLFDSSPTVLLDHGSYALPLLRWDAFHFGHVAEAGYVYEYEWAFFPGAPFVMRTTSNLLQIVSKGDAGDHPTLSTMLMGGMLAACLCVSTVVLYKLTLHHTKSPTVAFLAALLSLIPTSPVTLRFAAYSEPFFTYLSYSGMLYCARSQWLWATCCFTLAGTFRSNGFFLSGFILWGLLVDPILNNDKITLVSAIKAIALTAMTFVPFVSDQYAAYSAFCSSTATSPATWCSDFPPSIYTYVQGEYWESGFLKYWTPAQLPNILMGAPILAVLLWYTTVHIKLSVLPRLYAFFNLRDTSLPKHSSPPLLRESLNPHALHAFLLCFLYLFASHTQIILRQAASMPATYWAAAYLVMEKPTLGRWWIGWSVVWGAVSIVLWTTFLPPA